MLLTENGYKTPTGDGKSEIVEKRSRFIGNVKPVTSEEEAREEIEKISKANHDARHNCWCYILRNGIERYSDDGEPQGTAGLPMLEVFRRGGIYDVCCVVTRYFGGILLGTGGLVRAYTEAAKLALEDAGIREMRLWECMEIKCRYDLQNRIKAELTANGVQIDDIEYGEYVSIRVRLKKGEAEGFNKRLADISAGSVIGVVTGVMLAP